MNNIIDPDDIREQVLARLRSRTPEQVHFDNAEIFIQDIWGEFFNLVREKFPHLKHLDQQRSEPGMSDMRVIDIEKRICVKLLVSWMPVEELEGYPAWDDFKEEFGL